MKKKKKHTAALEAFVTPVVKGDRDGFTNVDDFNTGGGSEAEAEGVRLFRVCQLCASLSFGTRVMDSKKKKTLWT